MGYLGSSSEAGKKQLVKWALTKTPATAFEFGVGFGHFGTAAKKMIPGLTIEGCDIYPPAVKKHLGAVGNPYESVIQANMSLAVRSIGKYDMFMFGDCLEHVPQEEAFEILRLSASLAKIVLIRIPVGPHHKKKNGLGGNPDEAHLWTFYPPMLQEIMGFGYRIEYSMVNPSPYRPDKHIPLFEVADIEYHSQYELEQAHYGNYGLISEAV